MDQLKVDRTENKFVYPSNKTCILPTRDNPESQSTSGALTGTAGTSSTMVGTTGTEMGGTGLSQGTCMDICFKLQMYSITCDNQ